MVKRIGDYRVGSYASFAKFFRANFGECENEQLLKTIYEHVKLVFRRDFMYSMMSPWVYTVEFKKLENGLTQQEYAKELQLLAYKIYNESDFYAKPIGTFGGSMPDPPSDQQFVTHVSLRLLSENNWQLVKKLQGYEMPVEKFSRCVLMDYINIASVQTPRDLHVFMWLIACIHEYVGLEEYKRREFYFTHKLKDTEDPDVLRGHVIKAKMFNALIKKQNYEDLGVYIPGQLFGEETALPKPNEIFYQIMTSAVHKYDKIAKLYL
ncbi:hypothetical protein IKW75_03710 [Candidatus Saccharibacteria bacterium]|nr:hypothetical protein [Candidatus Saccharibacteria bacterium]